MGWLFTPSYNQKSDRKAFIADTIRTQDASNKDGKIGTFTCLKHCLRGNVLWAVWEISYIDPKKESITFIACYLIQFGGERNGWGYKDMEEASGPFYYSCPSSYLDMAPVKNEEWREKVRAYHGATKNLKVGDTFKLVGGRDCHLVSKRPMIGIVDGTRYRIPRRMIARTKKANNG
jgi:hypothetical protein